MRYDIFPDFKIAYNVTQKKIIMLIYSFCLILQLCKYNTVRTFMPFSLPHTFKKPIQKLISFSFLQPFLTNTYNFPVF